MRIKMLAVGVAPDYYEFDGETITAYRGSSVETYDLSVFPEDAIFEGADLIDGSPVIYGVERVQGELSVILCQEVGPGFWDESGWLDSATYDPDATYAVFNPEIDYHGNAWVKTRQGRQYVDQGAE